MTEIRDRIKFLDQLQPFFPDQATYSRAHTDVYDLVEASEWFLAMLARTQSETMGAEQVENFLIELEVHYVDHALYHLRSLKKAITASLATFPDNEMEEGSGGAA